jgi:hypothetical protein
MMRDNAQLADETVLPRVDISVFTLADRILVDDGGRRRSTNFFVGEFR